MNCAPSARRALFKVFVLAAAAWGVAGHGLTQTIGGAQGDPEIDWWRVVLATTVGVVVAAGAALAIRSRSHGAVNLKAALPNLFSLSPTTARRVRPLETVRVSPQLLLCLVRFDAREHLLAVTSSHVAVVESRDAPSKGDDTP